VNRALACLILLIALLAQSPQPASGRILFPGKRAAQGIPDPTIAALIDQVDPAAIIDLAEDLSGVKPATIGGDPYTIQTRYSLSGEAIQKAASYLFEYYQSLGLDTTYHEFNYGAYNLSNVIAEKKGLFLPERVYLLTAHYDDLPASPPAPGMDDNASGTVGVMVAADILSQVEFGCTLRFANFAAEEQGLVGSEAYASQAACAGEDIRGVINLDMIAWNSEGSSPQMELHAHGSVLGSTAIAALFEEVVAGYGLNLEVEMGIPAISASDHASFWKYGFPAVLAIEDLSDFNPNYHSSQDALENLQDLGYFTEVVKAGLAAFAHMGCLVEGKTGLLTGTVIDAVSQLPIPGVTLTLESLEPAWGYTVAAETNNSGKYQFEAVAGWHALSADGAGYPYTLIGEVYITEGSEVVLDTQLEPIEETQIVFPIALNGQAPVSPACP